MNLRYDKYQQNLIFIIIGLLLPIFVLNPAYILLLSLFILIISKRLFLALIIGLLYFNLYSKFILITEIPTSYTNTILTVREINYRSSFSQNVIAEINRIRFNLDLPRYPEVSTNDSIQVKEISLTKLDQDNYLRSKNIIAESKLSEFELIKSDNFIYKIKNYMITKVNSYSTEPYSSLINGITFGDTTFFRKNDEELFKKTGTSHIVAVSGFNFFILNSIVTKLNGSINKRYVHLIAIPIFYIYMLIVGLENSSALRAFLTICIVNLSLFFGKQYKSTNILLQILLLFLVINPYSIFDISLQLSLSTTFGILKFTKFTETKLKFISIDFIRESLAITLVSFLFSFPLILFHFNQVNLFGLIPNLLISPLISQINILTLIAIAFDSINLSVLSDLLFILINSLVKSTFLVLEYSLKYKFLVSVTFIIFLLFTYGKRFYKKDYFNNFITDNFKQSFFNK